MRAHRAQLNAYARDAACDGSMSWCDEHPGTRKALTKWRYYVLIAWYNAAMNTRLPVLPRTTDHGCVYVVELAGLYKIGFTRNALERRVKACFGRLVLTIPLGQHPARLERAIHRRFADKRAEGPGFKQEWFALTDDDITWLRGLSCSINTLPMA